MSHFIFDDDGRQDGTDLHALRAADASVRETAETDSVLDALNTGDYGLEDTPDGSAALYDADNGPAYFQGETLVDAVDFIV